MYELLGVEIVAFDFLLVEVAREEDALVYFAVELALLVNGVVESFAMHQLYYQIIF
jgi:hypothetical protein